MTLTERIVEAVSGGRRPLSKIRAEIDAPAEAFEAAVRSLIRGPRPRLFLLSRCLEAPGAKLKGQVDDGTKQCRRCKARRDVEEFRAVSGRLLSTCVDCRKRDALYTDGKRYGPNGEKRRVPSFRCKACGRHRSERAYRVLADFTRAKVCRACEEEGEQ